MSETEEPTLLGGEEVDQLPIDEEAKELSVRDLINQRREEELLKEVGEAVQQKEEPPKEDKPEIKEEHKEPLKFKVKIDGEEEEVPVDELLKEYQKGKAGDKRLQQAAEKQRELEAARLQLEQERQAFEQARQDPPKKEQTDEALSDLKARRRDAMEVGDWDAFEELDEEINQYRTAKVIPQQPTFDLNAVTQEATQRVQTQLEYRNALKDFESNNEVLVKDPTLNSIAMNTFRNMCAESESYSEAFTKTESAMKEWISSISPRQAESAMTDREAKKKSIPAEPGRLNAKTAPPPAKKEETASEIIANMRKARGLPV